MFRNTSRRRPNNNTSDPARLPLSRGGSKAANRIAQCTQAAIDTGVSGSEPANDTVPWYYWLRTPYSSHAYYVRLVNSDGSLNNDIAYYGGLGVRPLCNLKSEILVSSTTNGNGNYEILALKK
ncbi:DUF6273 domain-containing protein [Anaerotruncus rubiinfantis]|uniref:DUF6273 domain-containing protein n=1 Tax=Anaerotruncus rubiinfantis TaxID=1720200 RepID=UPI003C2BB37E